MKLNDPQFLRTQQYHDSSNLDARAALHKHFSTNPQGWFDWLFEQADIQPGERLLEVGGGPAYLWKQCLLRLPPDCRLFFSDFSAGMVTTAREALALASAPVNFAVLDAQSIPFPDGVFDRVMANYMLYHVPDRLRAIAELWRVLRPGGVLIAATNGPSHLRELHGFVRLAAGRPVDEEHITRMGFDLENGAEQLRTCFPQVELRRYPDSLRVTRVQPILDYLLSMSMWEDYRETLTDTSVDALRLTLEEQLRRDGVIPITKELGLFVAQKQA